jgi:membrane-bound serine protease (ClpP class)
MGEYTSLVDLLAALLRLFGLGESAIFPAVALCIVFFIVAVPVGILAQSRKVETGQAGMVGERGVTVTDISPDGKVFVHSEYWNAESATPISAGSRIRVVSVEGLVLRVEPL